MKSETVQHVLLLFLTVAGCALSADSASDYHQSITETGWRRLSDSEVSGVLGTGGGYQASVKARSKVECIRECSKYSLCFAVVFNVTSGTCYLQPGSDNGATPTGPHLGQVYINKNPKCVPYDAPESNGSVSWSPALTSLRGEVTCDDGFVNTTSDVTLQCLTNGSWQIEGRCAQHVWTNPVGYHTQPTSNYEQDIPLVVINGWSVCVEGIPLQNDQNRFTVDLMLSPKDLSLHANVRFQDSGSILVLNCMVSGSFGTEVTFPVNITVGEYFRLKITHTGNKYELYVADELVGSYRDDPDLPPAIPTYVSVRDALNLTRLDTWCFD